MRKSQNKTPYPVFHSAEGEDYNPRLPGNSTYSKLRIALVCPHIFMQDEILPHVIFSPGHLAISLANGLVKNGHEVTLFSPGKITTLARNETVSMSLLKEELQMRNYDLMTLMQKHPLLFTTLSRQIQTELLVKAYKMANKNKFDIVHVYMNEEEIGLAMSDLCTKPVVFTHHEPFNFLARYRTVFPKYKHKNWISISYAQRKSMPDGTNWLTNVYHGYNNQKTKISKKQDPKSWGSKYVAYFGRIIEPKGVHLAIAAVKEFNKNQTSQNNRLTLKIAGKHYNDAGKDDYWREKIEPFVDNNEIQYVGFLSEENKKQEFLSGASALLVPSTWEEPFGMVMIEALAVGTPLIGCNSGAISEIITDNLNGFLIDKNIDETVMIEDFKNALTKINSIKPKDCIADFKKRFITSRMVEGYIHTYRKCLDSFK